MVQDPAAQELLRKQALGWSFELSEVTPGLELGRDLRMGETPNGLDFAKVQSMDALNQALTVALTTRLGDDVFNIAFGFDGLNALAEESDPVITRERIRISVIQLLRKEPRVRRIVDVKLTGDGRLEPPPAGSRTLEVRVSFEAISGEQAAISLGKVIPNV